MQSRGVRAAALVAATTIVGAAVTIVVTRGDDPRPVDLTPRATIAEVARTAPCATETHEWTLVEDGYDGDVLVVTAMTRIAWTERCSQIVSASATRLHVEHEPGYEWCGTSAERTGYVDSARTRWRAFAGFNWDTPGGDGACQPFSYQEVLVAAGGRVQWTTGRNEGEAAL